MEINWSEENGCVINAELLQTSETVNLLSASRARCAAHAETQETEPSPR